MEFLKEYRKVRTAKKQLLMAEESKDIIYLREQQRKLIVTRNIQDILKQYYDPGDCEMIPIKTPIWAIPIVIDVLNQNGISYIVKESEEEVDIIYD